MKRSFYLVALWLVARAFGEPTPVWLFLDRMPSPALRETIQATGALLRTESRWLQAVSVLADEGALERMRHLPFVRGTSPVRRFIRQLSRDEAFSAPAQAVSETQRALVRLDRLHSKRLFGEGVRIGVLDTGFRTNHDAFRGLRVGDAYDFLHNDPVVHDEAGEDDGDEDFHGTQVLGLLGGALGTAPAAEFYLAKTEDVSQKGHILEIRAEEDYWIAGLEWCVERGCRVVNSSLGYSTFYTFPHLDGKTALVTLAAEEAFRRGTLVVNAAGNSGGVPPRDNSLRGRISPPADGEHVLAVGAATPEGFPSSQSAQGPTYDGRVKPDGLAPGVDVLTVSPDDKKAFVRVTGTSVAAPFGTGIVALLIQAFPQATAQDYLDALRSTASQATSPNHRAGYGVFNAEAAYAFLAGRYTPATLSQERSLLPLEWGTLKREARTGSLSVPHPNPSRRDLNTVSVLSEPTEARIAIFDAAGRSVRRLLEGALTAGRHTLRWSGRKENGLPVARGFYCVALALPHRIDVLGFFRRGK